MGKALLIAWLTLAALPVAAQEQAVIVGHFNAASPDIPPPWKRVRLDEDIPPTRYRVIEWEDVAAVEAVADGSMALLARPLEVNLRQTPVLCWRWRIDAPVKTADMTAKSGDDYAARVYVTFDLPAGAMSLGTRLKLGFARGVYGRDLPDAAVNYVWDNIHPIGTRRSNAYTDRAQMIVVRSGEGFAGQWLQERRDVLEDLRAAFGVEDASPVQLALATDTDNTGEKARAGFADLHFVGRETECRFPGSYKQDG